MTPKFFGKVGQTDGEQLVCRALNALPDHCVVFAEPQIVSRRGTRKPDFVVVNPDWGVIVLEVKDWREEQIRGVNDTQAQMVTGKTETSPTEQAKQAAYRLEDMLEDHPDLTHWSGRHAGKLSFSYTYAGVLPYMKSRAIRQFETKWGNGHVLGGSDVRPETIYQALERIPTEFRHWMDDKKVKTICNLLDPASFVALRSETGEIRGVLDGDQAQIVSEQLNPNQVASASPVQQMLLPELENIMPDEARDTALGGSYIRMVRGVAGTGKTDVLILRTHFLHTNYPELEILVTTFNDPLYQERLKPELDDLNGVTVRKFMMLCKDIYTQRCRWRDPQPTEGIVNQLAAQFPLIEEFGVAFVADEITWMKELGRTTRDAYVNNVRLGRGSGSDARRLGSRQKAQLFDIFEAYQEKLHSLGPDVIDWEDLPNIALDLLARENVYPDQFYDFILIDEAQHFAPNWIAVIKHFLKPGGTLFLCEDPSQSVYRHYSWQQKGLNIRGTRTRWLTKPYRNTRQIFRAAYALIEENELAQQLLADSGEAVPVELNHPDMRDGDSPQAHSFQQWRAERDFIFSEVDRLIAEGIPGHHIGLLHPSKHVRQRYGKLKNQGVRIFDTRRQTGLEYTVVFFPSVDGVAPNSMNGVSDEEEARKQLEFYMSMTRARDRLYLSYVSQWPTMFEVLRPHMEWSHHL